LSLPIAGAVLHFATSGRGLEPQVLPPPVLTTPAPEAAVPQAQPGAPTPAPAAARPSAPASVAEPPAASAARAPDVPAAVDRLTVVLSVKRPCWVSASVDGERQIERLLQPGERQTIDVRREMVITAGDASAITLTFNGAEAKPLGKTGDVVTARFTLDNYKDYVQARR
jgi:hypothetical protein